MNPLIAPYVDASGRMILWPARKKRLAREALLDYVLEAIDVGREYSEKEIVALIETRAEVPDHAYLRREMVDTGRLQRDTYGKAYVRPSNPVLIPIGGGL